VTESSLQVSSYRLEKYNDDPQVWIELHLGADDKWYISHGQFYFSTEPDAKGKYHFFMGYHNRGLWDSAEEAQAFWQANRKNILATAKELQRHLYGPDIRWND